MKKTDDWRPGPEVERAHHVELAFCDDPNCGPHFLAKRADGTPICEMVLSPAMAVEFMDIIKDYLYEKAVKRS